MILITHFSLIYRSGRKFLIEVTNYKKTERLCFFHLFFCHFLSYELDDKFTLIPLCVLYRDSKMNISELILLLTNMKYLKSYRQDIKKELCTMLKIPDISDEYFVFKKIKVPYFFFRSLSTIKANHVFLN